MANGSDLISDREDELNRAAKFLPQTEEGTLPCVVVGGVQAYVYFKDGELVISANYDDVDRFVPTRVRVNLGGHDMYWENVNP